MNDYYHRYKSGCLRRVQSEQWRKPRCECCGRLTFNTFADFLAIISSNNFSAPLSLSSFFSFHYSHYEYVKVLSSIPQFSEAVFVCSFFPFSLRVHYLYQSSNSLILSSACPYWLLSACYFNIKIPFFHFQQHQISIWFIFIISITLLNTVFNVYCHHTFLYFFNS